MRRFLGSLVGLLVLGSAVSAQAPIPARLRWTAGQVLVYSVEHVTDAADVMGESKSQTKSLVRVRKRWQVLDVDATGTATLQLSLITMYQERTTPSGDVLRYDSDQPEKSTPELKEAMARYLNTPLATIRVDSLGRVVEVKESKSDASTYEHELPFLVVLPAGGVKVNESWDRAYRITLAPPLGTGEKYDAVQRCRCKSLTGGLATLSLSTELKSPPTAEADAIPLWQMLPEGEVVVDVSNGRLHSARLVIHKELKDYQGENTSYSLSSTLTIRYLGDR